MGRQKSSSKNENSLGNSSEGLMFSFFYIKEETDRAKTFLLREMGLNLKRDMRRNVPINFTREEMSYYMKHFRKIDVENKGFLTLSDLKRHLQVSWSE